MNNSRFVAVKIVERVLKDTAWVSPLLKSYRNHLKDRDLDFITELSYGTVKHLLFLETVINYYLKKKNFKDFSPFEKALLTVGAYELLFLNKPAYATVSSYVELAKKYIGIGYAKLVNALLRKLKTADIPNLPDHIKFSFPETLFCYLKQRMEDSFFNDFIYHSLATHSTYIRVISPKDSMQNIPGATNLYFPETYKILDSTTFFRNSDKFQFVFQDLSSQIAQHLVPYVPRGTYIDLAAAPCNKASFLAQQYTDITVIANDIHLKKLQKFKNDRILSLKNLTLVCSDATKRAFKSNTFDVVIIDAPCSGLGTLRRKPEIKYRITPEKINEILRLQQDILETAQKIVKIGGYLVYMTCTINPDENEGQIEKFLKRNKDFIIEEYEDSFKFSYKSTPFGVYIDGLKNDCDYFFVSILKRCKNENTDIY